MAGVVTPASTGISSPSDSLIITSPALSASSLSSSFDFIAVQQQSSERRATGTLVIPALQLPDATVLTGEDSSFSDGDDEIVWSVSESEDFEGIRGGAVLSDDDFVVLDRAPGQSVSRPRPTAEAVVATVSDSTASQTGTVRGVPPGTRLEMDSSLEAECAGGVNTTRTTGNINVVAAELAKELARLDIGAEFVGESNGTKTLAEAGPSAAGGVKKKVKKPKKEMTEEEKQLRRQRRKERKEKRKQEKATEKALRKEKALAKELKKEKKAKEKDAVKEKEKKSKQVTNDVAATSTAKKTPLSPVMTPGLAKSISLATLLPSSSTSDSSDSSLASETEGTACTPPSGVQQLLSPPSSEGLKTPTVAPKTLEPTKKKVRRKNKAVAAALTSPVSVTITGNDGKNHGLSAQHNVVIAEKVSEQTTNQDALPAVYDEAVNFITSYISNPIVRHDHVCHLTLLQSFIVELGLLTDLTLLPRSIKSAKTFVKSRVFLNIKDYLSKRHEGQDKIKELMFPSRSALVRDMKRKRNHASLKWVKKQGLQDLLVSAFHHS